MKWKIYRDLYGTSEKRIDLINACAANFFNFIEFTLRHDVILAFCRLSDPEKTTGHKNLSLEQLQKRIEIQADTSLSDCLGNLLNDFKDKCNKFRKLRNKQLAHLDLNTIIDKKAAPLPGVSRKNIEEALEILRTYMNKIEGFYNNSEVGYEHSAMLSGAEKLVSKIKSGLRYEKLKRKILKCDFKNEEIGNYILHDYDDAVSYTHLRAHET